ncbi:MAG: cysteine hydrolase [Clostridia bacterium]|nr:cysteine hydrolase [Clostridia bacterium]
MGDYNIKKNVALLVIDMQNAYLPGNEWECNKILKVVKNIEEKIKEFPLNQIFFTKYIASENPKGVWKEYNNVYSEINSNENLNDYIKEIKKYITKNNSFIKSEYSSLSNLKLKNKLNEYEIIYVTGVVAECCVLSTIFDLIDMGKKIIYCKEAIAGQKEEKEKAVIEVLKALSPLHIIFK